jgi:hypothetical protein
MNMQLNLHLLAYAKYRVSMFVPWLLCCMLNADRKSGKGVAAPVAHLR